MPTIVPSPCSPKRRAPSSDRSAQECRPTPAKRHKASTSSIQHGGPSPGFWDRLSRVQLSRQGLREFDRRTVGSKDPAIPPAALPPDLPAGSELTRLQRFARRGGPPLSHLRGFACLSSPMSASSGQSLKRPSASSRTKSPKTSRTTPYSGQYEQGLIDVHVYPEGHDYDGEDAPIPTNYEDILRRLSAERASLSPSRFTEEDFKKFKRVNAQARGETRMMQKVLLGISGDDDHFKTEADVEFNHIKPFNKDLAAAKPDLYDGVAASKIEKTVRDQLDDLIIPSTNTTNPVAPNFFLEAKSDKGRADVAKKQACHDGAIGARAMHSLQNYGVGEAVYDGNAYSFTSSFHNGTGTLQMYTTHPTAPKAAEGQAEYHMTQIKAFAMTSDRETFQKGATYYRNARDRASTHRNSFIEQANKVASQLPTDTPSTSLISSRSSVSASPERGSDTSVDELALSAAPAKRSRHSTTPAQPREARTQPRLPIASVTPAVPASEAAEVSPRVRHSQQPTLSAKAPPTEVTTYKAKLKQKLGRTFERDGQLVFVPDEEWKAATMSDQPALFNTNHNVWCFVD